MNAETWTRTDVYAKDTWIETFGPCGLFRRAAAVCPDGRLRTVRLAAVADTFFSVRARLSYRGRTVTGFISFKSDDGLTTNPVEWVKFTPTGKHMNVFAKEHAS